MNRTALTRPLRALLAGALTVIAACSLAPAAHAGQFTITSCRDGIGNLAFAHSVSNSTQAAAYHDCNGWGGGHMYTYITARDGYIAPLGNAQTRVDAPAGAAITKVDVAGYMSRENTYWTVGLQFNDRMALGCVAGSTSCHFSNGTGNNFNSSFTHTGASSFSAIAVCGQGGVGCPTNSTGEAPYSRAYVRMNWARVVIRDDWNPGVRKASGALDDGGWHRGTQTINATAEDNTGIKHLRLYIDNVLHTTRSETCQYNRPVPCPGNVSHNLSINTAALSDGTHTYTLTAEDASGRTNAYSRTFKVDNNVPGRPTSPRLDGGEGWNSTTNRTYRWTNPSLGGGSPISRAHIETCKVGTTQCWHTQHTATNPTSWTATAPGGPGEYTLRVFLEDAAGRNAATRSDPIRLRYDNVAPGRAKPDERNGWINNEEANTYSQRIALEHGAVKPVSGISGYSVTVNGTTTVDNTIDAAGETPTYNAGDLPEGVNTIRAKAVSGASVPSTVVGETTVQVDRTHPEADIAGLPAAGDWQRQAVDATVTGVDQAHLSGMAGADALRPLEDGAYVSHRVDGGAVEHARGDSGAVRVAGDGVHTVTYRATDLAGNESAEKTATVRIDGTAPVALFRAAQAAAPNQLVVVTHDGTSGVDQAAVELRRLATTTAAARQRRVGAARVAASGDWQQLGTTRDGDTFTATIDPDTLEPGNYEARTRVTDRAGNTETSQTYQDGKQVQVVIYPPKPGGTKTVVINNGSNGSNGNNAGTGGSGGGADDGRCRVNCTRTKVGAGFVVRTKKLPRYCRRPKTRKQKQNCKKARKQGARPATPRKVKRPRYCKRPKTKAQKRKCKKLAQQQPQPAPGLLAGLPRTLKTPFGKRALARGVALTADGRPLAGAVVDVNVELQHAGARATRVGAIHTNHKGEFTYPVPAGPSRALRFVYRGDQTHTEAAADIAVRVPAATSIKANKRRLRLGQLLVLKGKLKTLGAPVPQTGKLIDLQARDRGKWRKFATVRTGRKGAWKARYRFEATNGTVTYPMRAVVRREGAYAFATGMSRPIGIKVRGR